MEKNGQKKAISQWCEKLASMEGVTMVAQSTINTLNMVIRNILSENVKNYIGDVAATNYAGTIKIST